jgi:hypothetical protein
MKVIIKWLKSPIQYGFAKSVGDSSLIDKKLADELLKKDEGLLAIVEEVKPKQKKVHTRPIREKDD